MSGGLSLEDFLLTPLINGGFFGEWSEESIMANLRETSSGIGIFSKDGQQNYGLLTEEEKELLANSGNQLAVHILNAHGINCQHNTHNFPCRKPDHLFALADVLATDALQVEAAWTHDLLSERQKTTLQRLTGSTDLEEIIDKVFRMSEEVSFAYFDITDLM